MASHAAPLSVRVEEVDLEVHEDEFAYWRKFDKVARRRWSAQAAFGHHQPSARRRQGTRGEEATSSFAPAYERGIAVEPRARPGIADVFAKLSTGLSTGAVGRLQRRCGRAASGQDRSSRG